MTCGTCATKFYYSFIAKAYSIGNYERQMFLTCLTSYWQT